MEKVQGMTQAAIEDMRWAVQAMSEATGHTERNNAAVTALGMSTRCSVPSLKQMTFNWKAQGKYNELLHFEMKVKSIFMTKIYDISETAQIIMNWLGCEDSILCKH